jgi:amino acid adenylation domain-containing protein
VSSEQSIPYWKSKLDSAASLELFVDKARPAISGRRSEVLSVSIPGDLLARVRELAELEHVEPFTVLLAAFVVLLVRYSRQDDGVIGAATASSIPGAMGHDANGPDLFEGVFALRCEVTGVPSFRELLHVIESTADECKAHSIAFGALVEALRWKHDASRNPIFQILFADHSGAEHSAAFDAAGQHFEEHSTEWPRGTEMLDLAVIVKWKGESARVSSRYNAELFDPSSIARLSENFLVLLNSAVSDPGSDILALPLLTEAERQTLLVEWNRTLVHYPLHIPLHKFIEEQVELTPDSIAVAFESQQLTYRELNRRANQLANRLRKLGVGADVLVGVCAERSLEMVIALLAAIKAGGAYVPLDPEYPQDRLSTMLRDANPPVVLTQAHLRERVPDCDAQIFCVDKDWASLESEEDGNLSIRVTGETLAYCIYTSGSTGKPKGVPNVHEGIVNRLLWMQDTYKLTSADRVLQKTPYSFDVSVWEFFWPLMTGATLVMAQPGGHKDPAYLVKLIQERQITTLHFVPSMLAIFLEAEGLEDCRSVRQVFASGEALSSELQARFFQRFRAKLHNLYGPTEAAVDVTYWECQCDNTKPTVPIGRPVANTQIYILDQRLQPVPIGASGELHIGGVQLARGYLNRPELTAEKFIRNPHSQDPTARLYKTGDLARFLPDGNVEYLGRIDHQVKLRGFRIELGEIESLLAECPGVALAAVTVREDILGDKRLVAYLVPTSRQQFSLESVQLQLKKKLPEFMVPSRFVVLDRLPMTTSGKVDRRTLPAPQAERRESAKIVSARTDFESVLLPIFKKTLGIKEVGVTDDFFELGGHSLLAARLLSEIGCVTGRRIPMSAMLRAATVESLARLITGKGEVIADSVVMQIQPGESGHQPLFAVVVPGVEAIGYAALARHLGPLHPFYKLQASAPVIGNRPLSQEEIATLAQEYVAAMRSAQPQGPYCFIGMCDDVQVCEQMVVDLERIGLEVGFFAILDTWVLQNSMIPWKWKIYYYGRRLRQLSRLQPAEQLKGWWKILQRKVSEDTPARAPGERTLWGRTYWPGPDFKSPVFRAPVLLFKRPKQPFYYLDDALLGWGQRSLSGVKVHEMELDHENLLREPHITTIGEILATHLQQVHRNGKPELNTGVDIEVPTLPIG